MDAPIEWIYACGVYLPVYRFQLHALSCAGFVTIADLGYLRCDAFGSILQWGDAVFQQCNLLKDVLLKLLLTGRYVHTSDVSRVFLNFVMLGTPCIAQQRMSILLTLERINLFLYQSLVRATTDAFETIEGLKLEMVRNVVI